MPMEHKCTMNNSFKVAEDSKNGYLWTDSKQISNIMLYKGVKIENNKKFIKIICFTFDNFLNESTVYLKILLTQIFCNYIYNINNLSTLLLVFSLGPTNWGWSLR